MQSSGITSVYCTVQGSGEIFQGGLHRPQAEGTLRGPIVTNCPALSGSIMDFKKQKQQQPGSCWGRRGTRRTFRAPQPQTQNSVLLLRWRLQLKRNVHQSAQCSHCPLLPSETGHHSLDWESMLKNQAVGAAAQAAEWCEVS